MRTALPEDIEDLADIELQLFPDNSFSEWTMSVELKHGKCWVEIKNGKISAYLLARVEGDLTDVLRVGVLPAHRRSGIAKRLMQKAMRQTPNTMLMVRKDNDPAIKLYLHLGFEITGEIEKSWTMFRRN